MEILAAQVGGLLKSHGLKLATSESCTGGGVAQAITEVVGSSAWFERGFITYSNLAKQQMLDVSEATLKQHGAVSEATVREMVAGALLHSTRASGTGGQRYCRTEWRHAGQTGRYGVVRLGYQTRRDACATPSAKRQSRRSAITGSANRPAGRAGVVGTQDGIGLI